jgi:phosphotransferase system  glucose/maltose/N-acetylglucosamine-specific IIC component
LGVAVFLSVLFSSVPGYLETALKSAARTKPFQAALAENPEFAHSLQTGTTGGQVLSDSSFLSHLDARLAYPFRVAFSDSMSLVFICAAAIIFVGLIVVIFLPQVELRMQSGLQAAAAERAEAAQAQADADASEPAPATVVRSEVD